MQLVGNNKKQKIVTSAVSGTLILVIYSMIFSFSEQDGEQTGELSMYFSEKCIRLLNMLIGNRWTEAFVQELANYFDSPLRKLAHFAEYAVLGALIYILLRQWLAKGRKLYLLVTLWVFVSAVADELHQFFVPGRWSSPADVLLDTIGAICAIILLVLLENHTPRRTKREKASIRRVGKDKKN